jgi:drug/metabolite transporter (DMT)-like permease
VLHLGSTGGGASGGGLGLGTLLVFAAVCCEAAYTLLGKQVSRSADPIVVAFLAAALAVPAFVPLAWWQWERFAPHEVGAAGWLALGWYGAGTLALGTWLWYSGVARVEGTVAAGFMGVMPASALILSYVLLREPFRWIHLAGFAVVAAGVLLVSSEHARMAERDEVADRAAGRGRRRRRHAACVETGKPGRERGDGGRSPEPRRE